jgi:hypothetical protein
MCIIFAMFWSFFKNVSTFANETKWPYYNRWILVVYAPRYTNNYELKKNQNNLQSKMDGVVDNWE